MTAPWQGARRTGRLTSFWADELAPLQGALLICLVPVVHANAPTSGYFLAAFQAA